MKDLLTGSAVRFGFRLSDISVQRELPRFALLSELHKFIEFNLSMRTSLFCYKFCNFEALKKRFIDYLDYVCVQ